MTPITPISRIPTEPKPPAVPSLWNNIYDQIDERLLSLFNGKLDNTKKVDGGAGVGGTPVVFDTVFTEIPGVSVTSLDAYIVGISAISTTGFTAIVRNIDGVPSALGFRWTAVGA